MKGYALSSSRDEMDFERAFEPLVPLKSEVRTVQGMFSVNCPGITTCMTPPHTQLSVHVLSSAGWFPSKTVVAPGTHGAGVTGKQG
jgi:hypothetical protein